MSAPKSFPPLNEVTFYQAQCSTCGTIVDDYGDYSAWGDPDTPRNSVVENDGWYEIFEDGQLVELLCPNCQLREDLREVDA